MKELKSMDDKLSLRINSIIDHIDKVLKDTNNLNYEGFASSDILIRTTCFSLVQIGEQMSKIEQIIGEKYAEVPWKYAKGMRNLIVHDYDAVDTKLVFVTAKNNLSELRDSFAKIKEQICLSDSLRKDETA